MYRSNRQRKLNIHYPKIYDLFPCRSGEQNQSEQVSTVETNSDGKISDTIFKCEYVGCDKFVRVSNKKQHMETHANERFICDIRHTSLATKNGLRAHFSLHYPKRELKCSI